MTVRVAARTDARRVAEVAASTFPLACPPGTRPEDIAQFVSNVLSAEHFENYIDDAARTVLIDETGDADVVGYAMLVSGPPADPGIRATLSPEPTMEVSKLYVQPTQHGSGAAGRLMSSSLDHARHSGCATAWLGVNQQNVRAQKFYAKHGFEIVGIKTFVVGVQTHDDYVMQVRL
ncbi:GNAT family N-acetyltransferase [Rhodococcus sp. 05-2254-6]|uniref:GNAT family N-acetyltransferase n=1 Tax=Rhodococcus sp. 05-2254-6 TaxID=2022489 RepID=UPI000B9B147D|nr:GNAT family N-acetyltransferase [Rhodococcus sp. 05-2254-6]